ncbi:ubiquitin carboxyl-terminal hydrolase 42-like [Strix aluco]|uniref:ubiquitin carboxyl-terminal hydrolase 42-like n=1 Tax=Strix aluco TaxID=111821 RepID=UPI003DA3DAF1
MGNVSLIAEGMAPPQRILYPPEKICMEWKQRRRAGAGLYNLGNTCFLNSTLQCLTYTPPLANYLLSREHSQSCHRQDLCMMCSMEEHVNEALQSSDTAIQPWAVIHVLTRIGKDFQLGMQGGARKFLHRTVNAMQRACLSGDSNLDISSRSTTIVHQIFMGSLRSRDDGVTGAVAMKDVNWHSQLTSRIAEHFDLPSSHVLELQRGFRFLQILPGYSFGYKREPGGGWEVEWMAASSVTAALENFVKPQQLDGENCFKCSKCDKTAAASKKITVHHVPRVLTVCLKRCEDVTGRKISKLVEYPQYLDLRPYTSQTAGEPLLYSLYAVLVHSGDTCHTGHFYCYVKASDGLWYEMNDESVDPCDFDTVLSQQAYLLFYVRDNYYLRPSVLSNLNYPMSVLIFPRWALGCCLGKLLQEND